MVTVFSITPAFSIMLFLVQLSSGVDLYHHSSLLHLNTSCPIPLFKAYCITTSFFCICPYAQPSSISDSWFFLFSYTLAVFLIQVFVPQSPSVNYSIFCQHCYFYNYGRIYSLHNFVLTSCVLGSFLSVRMRVHQHSFRIHIAICYSLLFLVI